MIALASKMEIKINNDEEIIIYRAKDEIPYEFRPSRTYWNYINPQNFLAETNMVYDVL